jgi:hypothetical protein
VAAYVAATAAAGGETRAGSPPPADARRGHATAENGKLEIPAAESGALAYEFADARSARRAAH